VFSIESDLSKLDNLHDKVSKAMSEGLHDIGVSAVEGAKATVHVITGELRDSIQILEENPKYVVAGTELEYAAAEEFGTATRPAHAYLGPQADRLQTEGPRIVQEKVNSVL
jgi:phage gpG-like protein